MADRFLKKRTIKQFQKNMTDLIDDLGREITIVVGSGIPSSILADIVNNEPADPNEEIIYSDTLYTVKAIIDWEASEKYEYLSGGKIIPGDVRIRCKIEDVLASGTDMMNNTLFDICRKVIIDGQNLKVAGKPVKSGLRDLYLLDVWASRIQE